MRIRPARSTDDESSPGFDLSSLIDVSFLLLIYFLATATLDPKEADLGLSLPSGPGDDVTLDYLQIEIAADDSIRSDGEIIEPASSGRHLGELQDRLVFFKATAELLDSEAMVIVDANDEASGQRFIDVLNCLAGADIDNVALTQ